MSLNLWSLVLFASHLFFYVALMVSLLSKSSIVKLSLMIASWLFYQVTTLWYGIATGQIGFILMFIFQFITTIVTILISTERQMSENI
jgi:hypothetical protein